MVAVLILSAFAAYFPLPDHYYFVQKSNFLNQYGVKLGWFWTCFVVCPFVWCTSRARRKNPQNSLADLCRVIIATGFWYFCTNGFITFEQMTGHCHGSKSSSRSACRTNGGKWVPGFDISGHCFILIYSILVMCEESLAFRNLPSTPRLRSLHSQPDHYPIEGYTAIIKVFFFLTFVLHILWDFELLISILFYHHVYQKLVGSTIAVLCWFVTYRAWYPTTGIPPMPSTQKIRT